MNTVYLVDDDRILLDHFIIKRGLFAECGFEICGAQTNPLNALEEIRILRPNAVLSDLKMPELSGIGLWEALKDDIFKPLFVLISAYNDFNDVRKFFTQFNYANYIGFDYLLKPVSDQELADLLNRLSSKLMLDPAAILTETTSPLLNEILHYLKQYPALNHTLETIGERFKINENYICNLFAKHLNTTFLIYLLSLRMEKAAELLRTTDKTVKEIGIKCGYTNYFYFTRVFDKVYHKTPSEYRRSSREE